MSAVKISEVKPTDHSAYFIDSNVWLAWFQHQRVMSLEESKKSFPSEIKPKPEYTDYLIFLDELITHHLTYDEGKHGKLPNPKPKILFSSLLATEIVNAYSRNISQRLFKFDTKSGIKTFKEYRHTPHYRSELRMLVDDILTFKDLCVCIDDNFNELDFFNRIKEFTNKYDFNDFFYMNTCKVWGGCPIITHDGDFSHPDFHVLTMNTKMLPKEKK